MRKYGQLLLITMGVTAMLTGCGAGSSSPSNSTGNAGKRETSQVEQSIKDRTQEQGAGLSNKKMAGMKDTLLKKYKSAHPGSAKSLIDFASADMDGDGQPELILMQGEPSEYGIEGEHENIDMIVYDPESGEIEYQNDDAETTIGLPQKLVVGDFTNDGPAEVKIAVELGGSAGGAMNKLLSYQQGAYVDLFQENPFVYDVRTMVTSDDRLLIYSDFLGVYKVMDFTAEQKQADNRDIGWRSGYRKEVQAGEFKYALQDEFSVTGPMYGGDYMAEVTVDYRFEKGKFVPVSMDVKSMNEMAVTNGTKPISFRFDAKFGETVQQGELPGLDVKMGMSKAEVSSILGKQTREFGYAGGTYYEFEKAPGTAYCFSPYANTEDSLFSVLIYGNHVKGLTYPIVTNAIGSPESEGFDEMDGEYYYHYEFDSMNASFYGVDENSEIGMIYLIQR